MKGLIIVWGAALYKLDVITALIESEVAILGLQYKQWKPGVEFDALKEFYSKSDEIIRFKMKVCSTSNFACFEIEHNDEQTTVLHRNELLRVVNVPYLLKIKLRSLFGMRDYIHSADSLAEVNRQLGVISRFADDLSVISPAESIRNAIIEGLSHSLPMISHTAVSMGQLEQIGDAGIVVDGYEEYAQAMKNMMNNQKYYVDCKVNAEKRYRQIYDVPSIMKKFIELYKEVVS